MMWRSPLLDVPGAVEADPPDGGVPAHYGDPLREQRTFAAGSGFVDRSHRGVVTIEGTDRLTWLHSLSTQALDALEPGASATTLVLSPQGHVEYATDLVDDGSTTWLLVERDRADGLVAFLESMRFLLDVAITDATADWATVTVPAGTELSVDLVAHKGRVGIDLLLPRAELAYRAGLLGPPVGLWAYEAARIAAHEPRQGFETDHRTIPHEVGWIETAVSLTKGCYRGQETVARVHNLGSPPRRLVFLHLDGSVERLPAHGDPVSYDGKDVGAVTSAAWHYELGPIALALIKRTVPTDAALTAAGIPASQEVVVSPDAGLHVGATIREQFGRRATTP
jgi:folate-binding protein YgfZ